MATVNDRDETGKGFLDRLPDISVHEPGFLDDLPDISVHEPGFWDNTPDLWT